MKVLIRAVSTPYRLVSFEVKDDGTTALTVTDESHKTSPEILLSTNELIAFARKLQQRAGG